MPESPEEWKDRIGIGQPSNIARRVGGEGTTKIVTVMDETKPRVAGQQIIHWDGRVDAKVTPEVARLKGRSLL